MSQPKWCKDYVNTEFEYDYPTDRESGPGPLTKRWIAQSRNWMKKFLIDELGCKPENFIYQYNWFEWYLFAKIGEQWWYFSTGDIRYKIMGSMLIRTAKNEKDYTGGSNNHVAYDNPNFEEELKYILKVGRQEIFSSIKNCYWRQLKNKSV